MRNLQKHLGRLRDREQGERGDGELVTALFIIPIVLWILFSLIDISLYMQTRSEVQNVARDSARQVAIYGGNNSRLNPYGDSIARVTLERLYQDGKCTPGLCEKAPTVQCTPGTATQAGQQVGCSITYHYRAIFGNNPITGFAAFLGSEFTVTETAYAETGF